MKLLIAVIIAALGIFLSLVFLPLFGGPDPLRIGWECLFTGYGG